MDTSVFIGRFWVSSFFFFEAEDGIRVDLVTGVQTCALPISATGGVADDGDKMAYVSQAATAQPQPAAVPARSEERRVGKECRSRGSRYH